MASDQVAYRIPVIRCRSCRHDRYDDGTRCDQCGCYQNQQLQYFGADIKWRDRRYEGRKFLSDMDPAEFQNYLRCLRVQ